MTLEQWFVVTFFLGALPAGAFVGLAFRQLWKPLAAAAIVGITIAGSVLVLALHPPNAVGGWGAINSNAGSKARFIGDLAYWALVISVWLASFGLGGCLAVWSKAGGAQRVGALILGIALVPVILIALWVGVISIDCSFVRGWNGCY